ncbi:MAG: methyltransferase [Planctomycetia bacterium]|jgi:SAM-dependent methyltransferase
MNLDPNIALTENYRAAMREKIIADFIGIDRYLQTPAAFEATIEDHVDRRFTSFKDSVLPWLKRHVGLTDQRIVEIGSGTGASTLAVLPEISHVTCFDLDAPAIGVADFRLRLAGYSNFTLHPTTFTADCATSAGHVDGVFMAAVLEHATFTECIDVLRNAWSAVRPGGWICIVDTPNRFSAIDHHTALLPFFSMLPPEVRMAYAPRSPRQDFAAAFPSADTRTFDARLESLTRWGAGISYHEFEIALGEDVHNHIVADGYEPEIQRLIGILPEDTFCQLQLNVFARHVNRAFSRRAFYLIIRKPDPE